MHACTNSPVRPLVDSLKVAKVDIFDIFEHIHLTYHNSLQHTVEHTNFTHDPEHDLEPECDEETHYFCCNQTQGYVSCCGGMLTLRASGLQTSPLATFDHHLRWRRPSTQTNLMLHKTAPR